MDQTDANSVTFVETQSHPEVCPNCGHCPTCGRSNQPQIVIQPTYPYYPYYPTWDQPIISYNENNNSQAAGVAHAAINQVS